MRRKSVTALVLSLVAPLVLGVSVMFNWYEAKTDRGNVYLVITSGLDNAYGWIALTCAVVYVAVLVLRRRYSLLTAVALSVTSLLSLITALEHYESLGGPPSTESTTAFKLALASAAVWSAQSLLALVLWRGKRTSGLAELASAVRSVTRPRTRPGDVRRLVDFRIMLAPWLIRAIFVIGVVLLVLAGAIRLVEGLADTDWRLAAEGLGVLVLGPIVVRLACEYSILFFRMNETLNEVQALMQGSSPIPTSTSSAVASTEPPASSAK